VQELLALERTLLAWIRTGVALIALGIVLAKFQLVLLRFGVPAGAGVAALGIALLGAGGAIVALAGLRYAADVRRAAAGQPVRPMPALGLLAAAVVVAIAIYGIASGLPHVR
jgi:putative membrane protein